MPTPHPAKLQSLMLLAAIALAYVVLHFRALEPYSLQIFTGILALFFILKRFKKAKFWHILPDRMSLEVAVLTFGFVYLIGATGNTNSSFYPLSYVHLFFLVFSTTPVTAIGTMIFLMLFHYSLEPVISLEEVVAVLSLPIIGMILLFAKKQYDEMHLKEEILEKEVLQLGKDAQKEHILEGFINTFLNPKLRLLHTLLSDPEEPKQTALQQLSLLETELEKMTLKLRTYDDKVPPEDETNTTN